MISFECLYYFTSPEISVIEIKRTDLPKSAPISDIYKWLVISAALKNVSELSFKSMDKNDLEETRTFIEGDFKFDQKFGFLNHLGKGYSLDRQNQGAVSDEDLKIIEKYLTNKAVKTNT